MIQGLSGEEKGTQLFLIRIWAGADAPTDTVGHCIAVENSSMACRTGYGVAVRG